MQETQGPAHSPVPQVSHLAFPWLSTHIAPWGHVPPWGYILFLSTNPN